MRAYDQMEVWSPGPDELRRAYDELWAAEHVLLWSAYQHERWQLRLAKESGVDKPKAVEWLQMLRNVLEHLDDADFLIDSVEREPSPLARGSDPLAGDDLLSGSPPVWPSSPVYAEAGADRKNNPSLRNLLEMTGRPFYLVLANKLLFGLIDPNELEDRARATVDEFEAEEEAQAADMWVDMQDER